MKAAILKAFGSPLAIEAMPDPTLGTGEVIVDVVAAPVLSYTNEVFSGERNYLLTLPVAPGCGAIGRVRAVGPDATRLAPGDWVACDPTVRSRDDALSPDITLQGWSARGEGGLRLQKHFHHGSFAEQIRVPTENAIRSALLMRPMPRDGVRLVRSLCPMAVFLPPTCRQAKPFWSAAPPAISAAPPSRSHWQWVQPASSRRAETKRCCRIWLVVSAPASAPVKLTGNEDDDRERMRQAAPNPIDCVLDILPPSATTTVTRAALMTVRPYGRVVLMGGVGMLGGPGLDLPYPWIMRSCITIHGVWMYPPEATTRLARLIRSGLLSLDHYEVTKFALDHANEAVTHAAANSGPFKMTVIQP